MSREPSSESTVSDLIDYLLETGVDIHMLMPDDHVPTVQIRVDCADAFGRSIRCVRSIDIIKYKSVTPEVRNMVMMQTIHELIKELTIFR